MEIPIKKSFKVEDGAHEGIIVGVQYRDEPHKYTDVVIEHKLPDGQAVRLTAGYPTCVSKNSSLGKLLERFGETLVEDGTVDPTKVLANKACSFMTMTQVVKDKGKFARVITESLKPKV